MTALPPKAIEGKKTRKFHHQRQGERGEVAKQADLQQAVAELCLQTIPVQAAGDREMTGTPQLSTQLRAPFRRWLFPISYPEPLLLEK